ncbi:MAG: Ycf66 family protein [Synechocystis sp.]|nr:Ycf66 family protein [Synechocystis sp.]
MVNFGLNSASILGLFLAVAGAGLYFLRSVRPEVSRDYDIFFSAVGLLCGLILLFQGWRLDPILQFGQLLLTGSTVFFAVETIRLRGITTEQARRSTPYADDRPVSKTRVYTEAELDQIEPEERDQPIRNNRRLRGYDDDSRSARPDSYGETETRPRRSPSSKSGRRPPAPTRPQRRPPSSYADAYDDGSMGWDEGTTDMWDEPTPPRRSPPRRPRPSGEMNPDAPPSRRPPSRRPRPASGAPRPSDRNSPRAARPYEDEPPAAYVDYQPIDDVNIAPPQDSVPDGDPPVESPRRSPRNGDSYDQDPNNQFDY